MALSSVAVPEATIPKWAFWNIFKIDSSVIVTFKYFTGSGNSVAIANGATVIVYATANDVTNPDIDSVSLGDVTLTGTQTLTNKTLTSPIIGTSILDTGSNELFKLTATGSATNEFTVANAPNNPVLIKVRLFISESTH